MGLEISVVIPKDQNGVHTYTHQQLWQESDFDRVSLMSWIFMKF